MTPDERQALREKHTEIIFREGVSCCSLCHHEWYGFAVVVPYPCDVIKVLDALEEANFQAAINYERGYDDGFKGSVADAESDNWAGGNDD